MGKILDAFLTDQLHVDSGTEQLTPEHKALCEKKHGTSKSVSRNAERQTKGDIGTISGNKIRGKLLCRTGKI